MNTSSRIIICSIFIALFSGHLLAQPSITQNSLLNLAGKAFTEEMDDRFSFGINVGSPGANQVWDFTNQAIPTPLSIVTEYLNPQSTPFDTAFAAANLAAKFSDPNEPDFQFYQYYRVNPDEWLDLGEVSYIPPPTDTTIIVKSVNLAAPLPVSYNTTWTTVSTDTFGDYPSFAIIDRDSSIVTVDGWGTVILPAGSFPCLRVQDHTFTASTTIVGGIVISSSSESSWSYIWVNDENLQLAFAQSQFDETNPNFTDAQGFSRFVSVTTGIADLQRQSAIPAGFVLEQNFPNPFNPTTTIRFALPGSAAVTVSVYNQLGQQVETLLSETLAAGSYQVDWNAEALPSGVYFIRLESAGQQLTRKAVLLK